MGLGGGTMFGWPFMTLLAGAGSLEYTVSRGSRQRGEEGSALDVLDARCARGEIGQDDHPERRSDLER